VQFKSVTMKNFMSFANAERRFDGIGLTLIEGDNRDEGDSNGAGKSSVWDAISWCLFGLTVRGLANDDVVHRLYKKDCEVTVQLHASGGTYSVTRYRRHSAKDAKGQAFGNRLVVTDSGGVVEKSTIADTQKWLIEELGVDFELFRCTVLFAQEERFNFVSETDKKQKEILSKVRRVDFGKGLINARQAIKDHGVEVAEIERKLTVLDSHVSDHALTELQEESDSWDEERSERVNECQAKIEETEGILHDLPEKVDLTQFAAVKQKINAAISNRQAVLRTTRSRKTDIEQRQGYTSGRFNDLKKLKDECPTCDQPIDGVALGAKLEELRLQRIALVMEAAATAKTIEKIEGEIADLTTKLAAVNVKESELRVVTEKIKQHTMRLAELMQERATIKKEINPVQIKIAEAKKKQAKIKEKIVELRAEHKALGDKLPYLQFWEQGYGDRGIKSFLFDTVCGTLTAKANFYLGILSGGSVSVSFDTQTALKSGETRERFECSVIVDGDVVPYEAYSGGEKTRISLAVDMALCDLMSDSHGSSFNIVVFDEQDQWLDTQGREAYLRLLKERAKTQRVFVVSHDSELKARFDSVWTVVKEGRVSRFAA